MPAIYRSTAGLRALPADVLDEVVREGELNLEHQLSRAAATEQRATAFAGLMITAGTAGIAAAVAWSRGEHPDPPFALLAAAFGIGQCVAGLVMIDTGAPILRYPIGNEPSNWTPENWPVGAGVNRNMIEARLSQAQVLQQSIQDNALIAMAKARGQTLAIKTSLVTIMAAGVACLLLLFTKPPPHDPPPPPVCQCRMEPGTVPGDPAAPVPRRQPAAAAEPATSLRRHAVRP